MVFLAEKTVDIPTKDLLSWIFDNIPYDQDAMVRYLPVKWLKLLDTDMMIDIYRCGRSLSIHICKPSSNHHPSISRGISCCWLERGRLCMLTFV